MMFQATMVNIWNGFKINDRFSTMPCYHVLHVFLLLCHHRSLIHEHPTYSTAKSAVSKFVERDDESFVAKLISKALKFEPFFPDEQFGEFFQAKKKTISYLTPPNDCNGGKPLKYGFFGAKHIENFNFHSYSKRMQFVRSFNWTELQIGKSVQKTGNFQTLREEVPPSLVIPLQKGAPKTSYK